MAQKYNTGGYDEMAGGEMADVRHAKAKNGLDTALTHDSGATDPSAGASRAWDATDVGRLWLDTTSPISPVLKIWQALDLVPNYGWRVLRILKWKELDVPVPFVFTTANPAAADTGWIAHQLAATLNASQDNASIPVVAVRLRLRAQAAAGETLGADDGYIAMRKTGTVAEKRLYANVAGRYTETEMTVFVDATANEQVDVRVLPGGGVPNFTYQALVMAILEGI